MKYFCLGLLMLLFACTKSNYNVPDEPLLKNMVPRSVPFNTSEGYTINPFTGDSIQPIINSFGDTVITGVPIQAKMRILDPESFEEPVTIPAGTPQTIPAQLNLNNIPGAFPSISVDTGLLRKINSGIDPTFFHHRRHGRNRDSMLKLKQVKGRPVPSKQPQSVKAWLPTIKDNARTNIKYLDVEHGLISTNLVDLLEDSEGRIWIASQTKGVSMYDGETFRHYSEKEGLCSNYVTSIIEDGYGNIWFGTLDGISTYDGCSFEHIRLNEDSLKTVVWSILEDSYGDVWFGTNQGLFVYNGDSIIHFTEKEGLINNHIWSVLEDKHGLIWLGTMGGVSIYNGTSFRHLTVDEGLTSNRVWSMLMDRSGRIWIGTDLGLNVFDKGTIFHIDEKDGLINNVVRTIQEDSHGKLWFGTHGGVSMYDGNSLIHITDNEGLSGNEIRSVLEDSQGNIWFASENGGISIFYDRTFTYFSKKDGFRELGIMSFLEDSQHNLWFGDWGSGVSIYDGHNFRHFTQTEGLIQNAVFDILEDSKGNIWLGTFDGLCKYDGNSFIHYNQKQGLSNKIITALLEDRDDNLWIGTSQGGVNMYNGKSISHFTENEGLADNRVRAILEDHQGNLWFGTLNGVSRFNGETFTHFSEKEGLCNNEIIRMLEDSDGNVWFGTNGGGVCVFNGSSFTCFGKKEGLSNNYITSLVEDHNGHIWVTTKQGLNRVVFKADSITGSKATCLNHKSEIHTYSLIDGLKSEEFIAGGVLRDSRNQIWWGSPKGVVVLDPDYIKKAVDIPVTQITRIDINGQFLDYRQLEVKRDPKLKYSGINRFQNYPLDLVLSNGYNHLTFYFAAIDWSSSQNLRYAYLMEGLDDHWITNSTEAMADYRNMPPGQYTFHVKAMGAADIWSEASTYSFKVLPPPWLKWWAYVIYTSMLILMVRLYRRFLVKREKMHADLRIKDAEVKKMQELDLMKSRFFANISHEFRTPLTLIQGPLEELKYSMQGKQDRSLQLFQIIKRNLSRLQELINQLLDISKLETGTLRMQVNEGKIVYFIKTIIQSFHSIAEHKKIKYTYILPRVEREAYYDADKLEKILNNLISNAFKYTRSGGQIQIEVRFLDTTIDHRADNIEIRVDDTGKGIPSEKLNKVFDRFYQIKDAGYLDIEGTGLGLALTKELVTLYRGDIHVESEPGKGSTFTVTLPISVEQFRDEEIALSSFEKEEKASSEIPFYESEIIGSGELLRPSIRTKTRENPLILVVEDNEDLCHYISELLKGNYRVITAANGRLGLKRAQTYIPDLVISDLMMPDMDGIEMCEQLKTDEKTDHIPVIMLTARADKNSKLEGLETGADDYLIKPFDNEELKVRIQNLLEQRRKLREKFRLEFLEQEPKSKFPSDDLFLTQLFEVFNAFISDPDFKMSQLSAKLNLSQSQIRRKVVALSGFSPNELLRYHRLKKAAIYFRSGHKNVAQVMYMVGFNNQSYFAKCFNKLFGVTPSQFIAAQNIQPASLDA